MIKPSFDRADNSKGYSFDNIKLTTFRQNIINGLHERKGKIFGKCGKPVAMKDDNGNELAWFCSVNFSALCLGVKHQTVQCAIKKNRHVRGFKFCYTGKYVKVEDLPSENEFAKIVYESQPFLQASREECLGIAKKLRQRLEKGK
jgi:hypothetical protein